MSETNTQVDQVLVRLNGCLIEYDKEHGGSTEPDRHPNVLVISPDVRAALIQSKHAGHQIEAKDGKPETFYGYRTVVDTTKTDYLAVGYQG